MTSPKPFRLPTDVRPTSYEIDIDVDPGRQDFTGRVRIALSVERPTGRIVLHARDIAVGEAFVAQGGRRMDAKATADADTESIGLELQKPLAAGPAVLTIAYTGAVSPSMAGLYLSKDGDEQCLATQCEATDARAIFPCFDEPQFKATLAWRITTPKDIVVLANGPQASRTEDAQRGTTSWAFAATPPVASYLAAFVAGAFEPTAVVTARKVPFRVWALGGKERFGERANSFAARLLPWYEDYFGQPYAFAKYDQVAVPSFSFGAMENVGLVTFRPSRLLLDPRTTSWREQKEVDLVVAHEFAHMWFGNLVTMRWWDDLWLNEAFAEWIAHRAVDELEPTHDVWAEFQGRSDRALATDGLDATHAIYHPVATPAEAAEMFDAITYGKGSSVLRMLEAFLGPEAFRAGLRTYMAEFAFGNAAGADLWRHLARASDQPVERVMQSWIRQPGHPVVRIEATGSSGAVTVRLRQKRYRSGAKAPPSDQAWDVPMVLRYADEGGVHETRHLLDAREASIRLPVRGRLRWLHANAGDVGFYRTDPDDALLERLTDRFRELTPAERVGLLRDQWGLVRNGARDPVEFLRWLEKVARDEDHYAFADLAGEIVRELERHLEAAADERTRAAYRGRIVGLFRPSLARIGAEPRAGEPPATGALRAALLRAVAGVGRDPATVEAAVGLAAREAADPASVDPNVAGAAVWVAAAAGDDQRFGRHVRLYLDRRDAHAPPQQVDRYLLSLAAFRPPALVQRTLGLLQDGTVPPSNVGPLLRAMLAEPHCQIATWDHVRARFKDIRTRLGEAWLGHIVEASGYLPAARRDEMVAFYDVHLEGSAQQSFLRAKETIDERAELMDRVRGGLAAWAAAG